MKIIIKSNLKDFAARMNETPKNVRKLLPIHIFRALTIIESRMKQNIRTRLNVITGSLLNSVQKEMKVNGDGSIEGSVGPQNVPYAAVQEYGHTFPARFLKPRNKLALKWTSGGKTFFSKGHQMPSFTVKGVRYMRDAIDDSTKQIEEELKLFLEKAME